MRSTKYSRVLVPVLAAVTGGCSLVAIAQVADRRPGPVNIAHRGASAYAPEHTLAAYRLALAMGADYVEQDLQLTKDGVLVCLHDPSLERTTNVEEVFPDRWVDIEFRGQLYRAWPVVNFTLAEVKTLDAGAWFSPEFAGERVPTFQEAIDLVKGQAGLYPEIKVPEEYAARGFGIEEEVVRVLAQNGLDRPEARSSTPVLIQSFSPESLRQVYALMGSTYGRIQLVEEAEEETLMDDERLAEVAAYASGVAPSLSILLDDPSRVDAARAAGLEIHPYTVRAEQLPDGFNDATSLMEFLVGELGVTGVFTDHPDLFPAR